MTPLSPEIEAKLKKHSFKNGSIGFNIPTNAIETERVREILQEALEEKEKIIQGLKQYFAPEDFHCGGCLECEACLSYFAEALKESAGGEEKKEDLNSGCQRRDKEKRRFLKTPSGERIDLCEEEPVPEAWREQMEYILHSCDPTRMYITIEQMKELFEKALKAQQEKQEKEKKNYREEVIASCRIRLYEKGIPEMLQSMDSKEWNPISKCCEVKAELLMTEDRKGVLRCTNCMNFCDDLS